MYVRGSDSIHFYIIKHYYYSYTTFTTEGWTVSCSKNTRPLLATRTLLATKSSPPGPIFTRTDFRVTPHYHTESNDKPTETRSYEQGMSNPPVIQQAEEVRNLNHSL